MNGKGWKATVGSIAVLALIFLSALLTTADDAENSVELVPRWRKGEKRRFEMVKMREQQQGGRVTLNATSRTDFEIEVLNVTNNGYALRLTFGETKFDDPKQAENPLIQQMGNLLKGWQIVLEVDSKGLIKGVLNWQELKNLSAKALDAMTKEMLNAGQDHATVANIRAMVASMFATKEQIEQMSTREVQLLYAVLGRSYTLSKPIEYESEVPNVFGGEPFPSRSQFTLKDLDKKSGLAVVTWKQTVSPDEARRIMEKTLRDMAARLGKPMSEAEEVFKTLTIEDAAEFSIHSSSGWIHSLRHTRAGRTEAGSQEDTLTIKQKANQ